jgi:hypothetical protein
MQDKPSAIVTPPPEGWRDKINENDELIGYIIRRVEQDRGISLSYQTVRDVLVLRSLYKEKGRGV